MLYVHWMVLESVDLVFVLRNRTVDQKELHQLGEKEGIVVVMMEDIIQSN